MTYNCRGANRLGSVTKLLETIRNPRVERGTETSLTYSYSKN